MGNCGKLYCTCCESAYKAGFTDGLYTGASIGYKVGYLNGFSDGYVGGYLDGFEKKEPLLSFKSRINSLLEDRKPLLMKDPLELSCGCYMTCSCKPDLKPFFPKIEPITPSYLRTLPCGCIGTCICLPKIDTMLNPVIRTSTYRLTCGCFGTCTCFHPY